MAAFDAAAVRAELEALQARVRQLEAEGADDEEIVDLVAEANELRDQIRNYESYPRLWQELQLDGPGIMAAGAERCGGDCWRLPGLLAPAAVALAAAAARAPGFGPDHSLAHRGRMEAAAQHGLVRRSDDPDFAAALWERLHGVVPERLSAVLAPAAEAVARTELWPDFPWEVPLKRYTFMISGMVASCRCGCKDRVRAGRRSCPGAGAPLGLAGRRRPGRRLEAPLERHLLPGRFLWHRVALQGWRRGDRIQGRIGHAGVPA